MKRVTVLMVMAGAVAGASLMAVGINAYGQNEPRQAIANIPGSECVNLIANVWTCRWTFKDGSKCAVTGGVAGKAVGIACAFTPGSPSGEYLRQQE